MAARSESMERTWDLNPADILRFFQEISHLIAAADAGQVLSGAADRLVGRLPIDRCVFLLRSDALDQAGVLSLNVSAESCAAGVSALGKGIYQLSSGSEVGRLLIQGKPLPLTELTVPGDQELGSFIADTQSKSVIAFPMVAAGKFVGCMTLHRCSDSILFPESVLELGEALAEELAASVGRDQALEESETESQVFRGIAAPALIIDRETSRICRVNQVGHKALSGTRKELEGLPLIQAIPDGQRIIAAAKGLSAEQPIIITSGVLIGNADDKPIHMDACISLLNNANRNDLLVVLIPANCAKSDQVDGTDQSRVQRAEELANTLTRQLSWERWVRQIICKLHASLDRDTLLQTVVDGFGRALGATRCLIVRTDGPASPLVTHEYVEPDISPLGLGRTGQFPSAVLSFFKHKVAAVSDLSALQKSGELSAEDFEYFSDNGIRSMVGAPIISHGISYGVIVILESGAGRKWAPHELDMLEIAANQTAVALAHSQSYLQLKDQLFNMNLLGNLTQQLTNTLELVSRSGKPEQSEDKARQAGSSPPLSLRELEVLKLIAGGLANREIAQRLFLTESTVELHASRIRKKLKLKSRTALVKYACDNGLA